MLKKMIANAIAPIANKTGQTAPILFCPGIFHKREVSAKMLSKLQETEKKSV